MPRPTDSTYSDLLLRLYQAVRTVGGCLACERNHVGPTALEPPVYCSCPCHQALGLLVRSRVLVEPTPKRRAEDLT